jgi:hypothetical protein
MAVGELANLSDSSRKALPVVVPKSRLGISCLLGSVNSPEWRAKSSILVKRRCFSFSSPDFSPVSSKTMTSWGAGG